MVTAVGMWSLHDAGAKWYAQTYPVFVILFWRSLFGVIPVSLLARRRHNGLQRLPPRVRLVCIVRGALGFCSFSSFVFALPLMPLADAVAVGMSAPIFITAASAFVLREHVGIHRWGAVLAGFAAILFIVRPGGHIPPAGAGLLIFSNTCYTACMMMTRRLGRTLSTTTISFYTAISFAVLSAVAVCFAWSTPTWVDLGVFVAMGLMAGLAQLVMTEAFRIAPPSTIAPFEYSGVIWAMALGYLIWGQLPGPDVLAGIVVIVAAGLYIVHRERLAGRRARAAA
jgi:drug/metabolite transporter (DMT)-like permease